MALSPVEHLLGGPHATLRVQALGAMVGALTLRLPDGRQVAPLYRAPWHGERGPGLDDDPLLRHLGGEWLCAPFGPAAAPSGLPAGWQPRTTPEGAVERQRRGGPPHGWDHGWIANHDWTWVARDVDSLQLQIEPPADHPLARVERLVRLAADGPRVEVITTLHPRQDLRWPIALHPTFALPAEGRLELRPGRLRAVHAYPLPPVPGVSRVRPGARAASLHGMPTVDGGQIDLGRLPLARDTEELLQLEDVQPPFTLRLHRPAGTATDDGSIDLVLDWDATLLPDLLLWISQRGRRHAPWNARNLALGVEPCASCFDLTRVAEPPADHPLAHRCGLVLRAGEPQVLRWSLAARDAGDTAP